MPKKKIAYVMSRFPFLPETFILREMNEMEAQGWDIALFPLINQDQSILHEEARRWLARAHKVPLFSLEIFRDLMAVFLSRPGVTTSIFLKIIFKNTHDPRFLIRSLAFFPKAVHLARSMQKAKIEHVHAHYATFPALAGWIAHQLTGISYSVTVHAHDIFESKSMLAVKMEDAGMVIAISDFNRRYLTGYLGEWINDRIHVVHCGIRPEQYLQAPLPVSLDGALKVIHIGSLQAYKGQKFLIEACRLLKNDGIPVQVQMIGMGVEQRSLEGLIDRYDLFDEVKLLGPKTQEEIAAILPAGHCYVQPSIIMPGGMMEGIPVALMEAMACGLPAIASRISGIPELIQHEENGLLIPPEDPEALAMAFKWVYENYPRAKELGLKGREKVLAEFDLHKNVTQLGELFHSFLQ